MGQLGTDIHEGGKHRLFPTVLSVRKCASAIGLARGAANFLALPQAVRFPRGAKWGIFRDGFDSPKKNVRDLVCER